MGRAIERLDSFEVRQLLIEWISRFGSPFIFIFDNAEAFKAEHVKKILSKFRIVHRPTPVYDPQANGSVERTIRTIEEGLRVELANGTPPQEAIHIICGRINRTTAVPGASTASCPRDVVFKFTETHPFNVNFTKKENFKHDLQIGQPVLVRIPNASKLSPQFEDKGVHVIRIEGNHVYALADADGKEVKVLYRRERLKPIFKLPVAGSSGRVCLGRGCEGECAEV